MISFIVIGQNEEKYITRSLQSIYSLIALNNINESEIIYVDSGSTDNSLEKVKEFKNVTIFKSKEFCNAAVARNIGAQESKGDILFFIDGDMEVDPGFLKIVIDDKNALKFDCVTGHVDDVFYDHSGLFIGQLPRTYKEQLPAGEQILTANGGIFLIKRSLWQNMKGMRSKFRKSQDIDLTLRLAKAGIKSIRVPFMIAHHHTVDYRNDKRMWQLLFSGAENYTSVLLRNHLFNVKFIFHILRSNYTSVLLIFIPIALAINKTALIVSVFFYFFILALRVYKNTLIAATNKLKLQYFFERLAYQFLRDIIFWLALLFFFPAKKEMVYSKIQ